MTRRVTKAPENVRAWAQWCRIDPHLWADSIGQTREGAEAVPVRCVCARVVPVVILRRADYRRLLRAAAGNDFVPFACHAKKKAKGKK
jgi:hypothetical protein